MNTLNFNQSVGFPFETNILDEMQKAYTLFNALGYISGNFSIISGCELVGTTVANGVVFINGEVLNFVGGEVQTNVIIVEAKTALEFEDLSTHDVIFTRHATFGTATEQWLWDDFKRGVPTVDLPAMFAGITAQFETIIDKLNTIDRNAKVQVNTDWNAVEGKAQLLNKPTILSPFLYKGIFSIGDVTGADNIRTVNLSPAVSNSNYMVLGSLVSKGEDYNDDNDVLFMIRDCTVNSFKLCLREVTGHTQDLEFHYVLLQL